MAPNIQPKRVSIVDYGNGDWPTILDMDTGEVIHHVRRVVYERVTNTPFPRMVIEHTPEFDFTVRDSWQPYNYVDNPVVQIEGDARIQRGRWLPKDSVETEVPVLPVTNAAIQDMIHALAGLSWESMDMVEANMPQGVEIVKAMLDRFSVYRER